MSFSANVREELSHHSGTAMHCRIAELAAFISYIGEIRKDENGQFCLFFKSESLPVIRKLFTILKKMYNIGFDIHIRRHANNTKNRTYILEVNHPEMVKTILEAVKIIDREGHMKDSDTVDPQILRKACCKRAFLRGAFICSGSISEPGKTYHFEIVCDSETRALQVSGLMESFGLDAKWILRKKYYVVYLKEASQIVDMLNVMEAHVSLMELENIRILKEMRNGVNRRINCEMANINKTVSASTKQVEDITYIKEHIGFSELSDGLREIAELRLTYPEASLIELGKMLTAPVGKSGVNHRLRKLSQIAQDHRQEIDEAEQKG